MGRFVAQLKIKLALYNYKHDWKTKGAPVGLSLCHLISTKSSLIWQKYISVGAMNTMNQCWNSKIKLAEILVSLRMCKLIWVVCLNI